MILFSFTIHIQRSSTVEESLSESLRERPFCGRHLRIFQNCTVVHFYSVVTEMQAWRLGGDSERMRTTLTIIFPCCSMEKESGGIYRPLCLLTPWTRFLMLKQFLHLARGTSYQKLDVVVSFFMLKQFLHLVRGITYVINSL